MIAIPHYNLLTEEQKALSRHSKKLENSLKKTQRTKKRMEGNQSFSDFYWEKSEQHRLRADKIFLTFMSQDEECQRFKMQMVRDLSWMLPPPIQGLRIPDRALECFWYEAPPDMQDQGLLAFTPEDPVSHKCGTISRCGCRTTNCSFVFTCLPKDNFPTYLNRRGPNKGFPKFPRFCPSCSQSGHTVKSDQRFVVRRELLIGYHERGNLLSLITPDIYEMIVRYILT